MATWTPELYNFVKFSQILPLSPKNCLMKTITSNRSKPSACKTAFNPIRFDFFMATGLFHRSRAREYCKHLQTAIATATRSGWMGEWVSSLKMKTLPTRVYFVHFGLFPIIIHISKLRSELVTFANWIMAHCIKINKRGTIYPQELKGLRYHKLQRNLKTKRFILHS